jgi:hypothetical protein
VELSQQGQSLVFFSITPHQAADHFFVFIRASTAKNNITAIKRCFRRTYPTEGFLELHPVSVSG